MSSTTTSPTLTFPHAELTKIAGEPTNTAIKLLKKEIYANARAIPSTRGGGGHGHLGLVMPPADYLTLAGQAFDLPAHPGAAPAHAAGATQAQIAETIRLYNSTLLEISVASTAKQSMKKQLLEAVDHLYLAELEDDVFGYSEVTIAQMITHLEATYGTITREELEKNRNSIATAWTLDDPIPSLWERLKEIKRISIAGNDELSDTTLIELTFLMFEKTGVFTTACDTWRVKPAGEKTMANFKTHFNAENKERLRKLTAAQAGFHGANHVDPVASDPPSPPVTPPAPAANSTTVTPPPQVITNDGIKMYYCWTHGLGTNPNHTSPTCQHKAEGHKDDATVSNMQGGSNTIMTRRGRRRAQE